MKLLPVEEILRVLRTGADEPYREGPLSMLDHALQCATRALQEDAPDTLVVAALLHDIGHLVEPCDFEADADDLHQYTGVAYLRSRYPASVLRPIRLHVEARRYLCAVDTHYWNGLSRAQREAVRRQGGAMTSEAIRAFVSEAQWRDALRLAVWDDAACRPGQGAFPLERFVALLKRCALPEAEHRPAAAPAGGALVADTRA